MNSTSPPPPVSSLRSKFEQMSTSSSATSSSTLPINVQIRPNRQRSNSNVDLNRETQEHKQIVSGSSDMLTVPILRSYPSSPDLKSFGKNKPVPPPPLRGSRTPSPQPLRHSPSPDSGQMEHPKPQFSRRPPPPPPPSKSTVARGDSQIDSGSPGGISSLLSKFKESSESFGSGRPVSRNETPPLRSISTVISPPALPARPGSRSPIKGPRASLPILNSFKNESTPPTFSTSPRSFCVSPANDDIRVPPPLPSRNTGDSRQSDQYRSSSESGSGSEHGRMTSPPVAALRRMPPPPPPPPLPLRRTGSHESDSPPPLPRRRSFDPPPVAPPSISIASKPMRTHNITPPTRIQDMPPPPSRAEPPPTRTFSSIPPPPTRTVGLHDKVPAARRRRSSDSSSDEEEEPATSSRQELPDATHCSRRPPLTTIAAFRSGVPVPPGSVVIVGGTRAIVTTGHELKVYDMSRGVLSGVSTVDLRDVDVDFKKEARVTAMEFRTGDGDQEARILWCGTKEGHLFEFDVIDHVVRRVRSFPHAHTVTRIMRHGRTMLTLDDSGKVLVWRDYEDLTSVGNQQPRVARTTEKQGFVRVFDGVLWMSSGSGSGSSSSASATVKGPVIRVYDILATNSSAKLLVPLETLGAVTSGTMLPSYPNRVYLGHEGGFVSVWTESKDTFDSGRAVPICIGTVKISNSDVLALEGVVDKLWTGSRGGVIAAYSVDSGGEGSDGWRMTNAWMAHGELPVSRIVLDPFSIAKSQSLHVVSVGRDEVLRFWDGFLSAEWIESELQRHEDQFSTFRPLKVLICSWNTDAQKPDVLTSSGSNPANLTFLEQVLRSADKPDIISFGFQELIDLENRSLTAKTVLLGAQKKADGSMLDKVSRSYRMWHDALVHAVRLAMPNNDPYVVAHTDSLVGLFSCIFVRQKQKALLRDSHMKLVKRGMGGRYGNKGAIVARFVIDDSSLCFINCHLAAGQSHTRARNRDIAAILEDGTAFPRSEIIDALPYAGGGDGSMILDHEICFLNGDLNYRIDLRRDAIIPAVDSNDLEFLLKHDQLRKQTKNNPGFRLRSFTEAPITFAPTYKYDRRSDTYDSSEKKRAPAWCDRILWRCREPGRVRSLHYKRYEVDVSDHRPISGAFCVTAKQVDHEARGRVKAETQKRRKEMEMELLFQVREYYEGQCVL